jgi:hypothetical protein
VAATVEAFGHLKFDLSHPPCSPDLAASYYHMFGLLKEALHGQIFVSDGEVNDAVHMWF